MKLLYINVILVMFAFTLQLNAQDQGTATNAAVAQVVSFAGLSEQYDNAISWASVKENNCSYFSLERSCDHVTWEEALELKGEGNSTQQLPYSCKDEAPYNGFTFYRLKEVAGDGSYTYSPSIVVESKMHISIDIQPNPAVGIIKVTVFGPENENSKLSIKNTMGQPVFTVDVMNNNTIEIDIESYPEGVYAVEVESKDGNTVQRLVKR